MSAGSSSVGCQSTSTDRFCNFPVAFDNILFGETKQSLLRSRGFHFAFKVCDEFWLQIFLVCNILCAPISQLKPKCSIAILMHETFGLQWKQVPLPLTLTSCQGKLLAVACQIPSSPLLPGPPMPALCVEAGGLAEPRPAPRARGRGWQASKPHIILCTGCSLPSHAYPSWERPKVGPNSSSPDVGEVTPLFLRLSANSWTSLVTCVQPFKKNIQAGLLSRL